MPVFINNADDFLGPSQACVNPLFAPPPPPGPSSASSATDVASARANDASSIAVAFDGGAKPTAAAAEDGGTSRGIVPRRRMRRRRAPPRIVRCEDGGDAPGPGPSAAPVRLAAGDERDEPPSEPPAIAASAAVPAATTQRIKKKATVSLSDCLACSGCVTSAEAVLVSHHSVDKLRELAPSPLASAPDRDRGGTRIAFTISAASAADLYRHLYLEGEGGVAAAAGDDDGFAEGPPSRRRFLGSIAGFLHAEFGAEILIDGALSQRVSLMEAASEFCHRHRTARSLPETESGEVEEGDSVAALPSIAVSSTRTRYIKKQPTGDASPDDDTLMEVTTLDHPPGLVLEGDEDAAPRHPAAPTRPARLLPVLASSCPGFVCLVEKTAPAATALLSSAKSPMAVAGTLLGAGMLLDEAPGGAPPRAGRGAASGGGERERRCCHVAIAPCHDKKLEAGRGDLAWERRALLRIGRALKAPRTGDGGSPADGMEDTWADGDGEGLVREVDLVLTTGELLEVLADAAARSKAGEGAPASTARPPNGDASEEADASAAAAVRSLLAKTSVPARGCTLVTAESDELDGSERTEGCSEPELDTGVHGSGSYADFVFRYAARDLFGCVLPPDEPLPWKSPSPTNTATVGAETPGGLIRRRRRRQETTDLREVALYEHGDGTYTCRERNDDTDVDRSSRPVLRFATAYGFKNVQRILQGLSKAANRPHDYVEVMACPSGCPNGGGQVGSGGRREAPRAVRARARSTASAAPLWRPAAGGRGDVAGTLGGSGGGAADGAPVHFGEAARRAFHTRFHVVPAQELSTGAAAGVAVSDTRW